MKRKIVAALLTSVILAALVFQVNPAHADLVQTPFTIERTVVVQTCQAAPLAYR